MTCRLNCGIGKCPIRPLRGFLPGKGRFRVSHGRTDGIVAVLWCARRRFMTAENECIGHWTTATMMMVKNVINESGKCEHNGPQHPFNLRSLLSGYTAHITKGIFGRLICFGETANDSFILPARLVARSVTKSSYVRYETEHRTPSHYSPRRDHREVTESIEGFREGKDRYGP